MARKSIIQRQKKREALVKKFFFKRQKLTDKLRSSVGTHLVKARFQLKKLPRDSSPLRLVGRCSQSGRARAYSRRFGLSRIAFRQMAQKGLLPGVTKASW